MFMSLLPSCEPWGRYLHFQSAVLVDLYFPLVLMGTRSVESSGIGCRSFPERNSVGS